MMAVALLLSLLPRKTEQITKVRGGFGTEGGVGTTATKQVSRGTSGASGSGGCVSDDLHPCLGLGDGSLDDLFPGGLLFEGNMQLMAAKSNLRESKAGMMTSSGTRKPFGRD